MIYTVLEPIGYFTWSRETCKSPKSLGAKNGHQPESMKTDDSCSLRALRELTRVGGWVS